MKRVLARARHALLTDPVTGLPLTATERASLAFGTLFATGIVMVMLILSLGLGAVQ
ncbi:hypothetical protein ACFOKF_15460 [Sphingobium rhizovicinum]|uniref:Uncharacterized protein n=1 Tax=Sphingobium rhizovicinum TaxID=432308 RepID=A0ABV7NJC6_9SPHN